MSWALNVRRWDTVSRDLYSLGPVRLGLINYYRFLLFSLVHELLDVRA
jgi:hypothetical protein